MVEVRNANMSYGSKCVLRGFNMTVPEGSMYAFLGPSGCGKTTLLSCLVGEKTLDSGHITLGVRYKDQIGYMPQDTALSASLTIGESVTFYRMLFGLSKGYVKEKMAEIIDTLDIPPLTTEIQHLSGGQQRRVSLCIAMLHDPTLLILDEPTVGLDPLLSKRAWDYLDSLVRTKNKTVIITTHYVEEAKQADRGWLDIRQAEEAVVDRLWQKAQLGDGERLATRTRPLYPPAVPLSCFWFKVLNMGRPLDSATPLRWNRFLSGYVISAAQVGMLRGGVLIVEGCPRALMAEHDAETLETVFLRLSQKQEAEAHFTTAKEDVRYVRTDRKSSSDGQSPVRARHVFSPGHVVAHLCKNYFWLNHNKPMGAFIVSLAALIILLFGFTFGRDVKYMKVGIVNEELENGVAVDCKKENTFNCSDPIHSSCWFMKSVGKRKVVLVDFENEESAIEAAKKNYVWGYIRLKKNFTDAYFAWQELGLRTPPEILEQGHISIRLDTSNRIISYNLERSLISAYFDFAAELYEACGWPVKASTVPILFQQPVHDSPYSDFTSYGLPAVLIVCLFFMQMMICCAELINEKVEGVLERNLISGLTYPETLLADAIYVLCFALVQIAVLLSIIFLGFGIHLEGSLLLLFCVCVVTSVSGLTYGMFASFVTNSLFGVTFIGVGTLFATVFLSGLFWPREAMHNALRIISYFFPMTPAIKAVHAISYRGYGLAHPSVYSAFLQLIVWTLLFLGATYVSLKKNLSIQPKQN